MKARLQMRRIYPGIWGNFWQYRFVRESNGAGGRWKNTEYLAWIEWRRFMKAA